MSFRPFLLGTLVAILPACSTGNGGASDGGRSGCTTNADCGAGELCGFAEADGCSAKGACYPMPTETCDLMSAGCACDGSLLDVSGCKTPPGVFSKPFASTSSTCSACDSDDDCWLVPGPPCNLATHTCEGGG